jgi:cytosine/adenosine deaminase-related metal-dependent hydrolase
VIRYRAAWVLPIASPPLRDAWVQVDEGRIMSVGTGHDASVPERDLGHAAILPGLVNAHTHLELSYLRGTVPPSDDFVSWIRGIMGARRERPDPRAAEILDAVQSGIEEAVHSGTALVGDISNTLVTVDPLRASTLAGVVFFELIRFNPPDAAELVADALSRIDALGATSGIRTSLAAHAPYSVGPSLFRALRDALRDRPDVPCSVHLSESPAEVAFLEHGGGPWRALLEEVGTGDPAWAPPGVCPVDYLHDTGFLEARTLAVHGVQMTSRDLARVAASRATLVTCPRSNRRTGAGTPPVERFYDSGVRVAIGTDSLASTPDLSVFAELADLRALAPSVPATRLLESATRHGAHALGFGATHGTLESGRSARMIAVALPPGLDDVEEYLVSGIEPAQVTWVDTDVRPPPPGS